MGKMTKGKGVKKQISLSRKEKKEKKSRVKRESEFS